MHTRKMLLSLPQDYMSLLSVIKIATKTSKQALIKQMVTFWIEQNKEEIESLISQKESELKKFVTLLSANKNAPWSHQ